VTGERHIKRQTTRGIEKCGKNGQVDGKERRESERVLKSPKSQSGGRKGSESVKKRRGG